MRDGLLRCFSTISVLSLWLSLLEQPNGLAVNRQTGFSQQQAESTSSINVTQLIEQGRQQYVRGQLKVALQTFQKSLALYQSTGNSLGAVETLNEMGKTYTNLGQYQSALAALQKALLLSRKVTDLTFSQAQQRQWEGRTLSNLGEVYRSLGQRQAIDAGQQALLISRETHDRIGEAQALYDLGGTYTDLGQYKQAFSLLQQALSIFKELGDRLGEGRTLQNLGLIDRQQGQASTALATYEAAAQVMQRTGDALGQGRVLNGTGLIYYSMGDYARALNLFQQALKLRQTIGDRLGEAYSLSSVGLVYDSKGDYSKALALHQQALKILTDIGSPTNGVLNDIGGTYYSLNQYAQALAFYQKALDEATTIGDRSRRGRILNNLASVYSALGQADKALELYRQALTIHQANGERPSEAATLDGLAAVYQRLDQPYRSLESYQEALKIRQAIGDQVGMGATLNNLGLVYDRLGQAAKALESHQQALALLAKAGNRAGEGLTLNNISLAYANLGQPAEAVKALQKALSLTRQIGDRGGESITLSNLGYLFAQQKQPQLAITFYKESVNLIESIRSDLRSLPKEQQDSYTKTVADTYRQLADLLITQGRIGEAQQVLERLKTQELNDFTKGTRAAAALTDVPLNETEQKIRKQYGTLIAFGTKLHDCNDQCPQYHALQAQYAALTQAFDQQVQAIETSVRDRRQEQIGKGTQEFIAGADKIVSAQPGTVLIYPLVLPDKVRLLWAAKGTVLSGTAVCPMSESQLWQTVIAFRKLLDTPASNLAQVQTIGKQLYDCLVKPIAQELQANQIQQLVFVPDRATNYIPMGALFDGNKYLLETYTVSNILSVKGTDMMARLPRHPQDISTLALGLSNAVPGFSALPNVPAELAAIVKQNATDRQGIYPGTKLLNQAFTEETLRRQLKGRTILHIATHAAFKPDNPRNSYLLLGTGSEYPIYKIQFLQNLRGVHLVVLSACETALGGTDPKSGIEIAGISSFFLEDKVKAVIASLWAVNDASTSLLMQQFYKNLATGTMTKAEALRQAQLSLLKRKLTAKDAVKRGPILIPKGVPQPPQSQPNDFSHPYYWAPFILIGNGL